MTEIVIKKTKRINRILKWIVPKIAGIGILLGQAIQHNGRMPQNAEEWSWVLVGVGITFASNSKRKID